MSELRIELDEGRTVYRPGDSVSGTATWKLDDPPDSIEVRLGWYTEGKGTTDAAIVHTLHEDRPGRTGSNPFEFELPIGPDSFSGSLITLIWTVEIAIEPVGDHESATIIVSPTDDEIALGDISETTA